MSYIPVNRNGKSLLQSNSYSDHGRARRKVTGYIVETAYAGTSVYGNAYYDVAFIRSDRESAEIEFLRTKVNASINYGLRNAENTGLVELTLTASGRIENVKAV